MGMVLRNGRLDEAKTQYRASLQMKWRIHGDDTDHPNMAITVAKSDFGLDYYERSNNRSAATIGNLIHSVHISLGERAETCGGRGGRVPVDTPPRT